MERDYPRRLDALAASLPAGARAIALLSEGDRSEAAALAVDLAAAVSEHRAGHTILASLEEVPATLDHELGGEGGYGLSDVLRGRKTLAEVAVSGRARGFIYVPAGTEPIRADRLLASRAWAKLSTAAVARGATLLLFLPTGVPAALLAEPLDGVVWLGRAGLAGDPARRRWTDERRWEPVPVLGRLAPPGAAGDETVATGPAPGEPGAPSTRPGVARPGDAPRAPSRSPARPRGASAPPSWPVGPVIPPGSGRGRRPTAVSHGHARPRRAARIRRRGKRRRRSNRRAPIPLVVLLLGGAGLAVGLVVAFGSGDVEPSLPENDAVWSSPLAPQERGPAPVRAPASPGIPGGGTLPDSAAAPDSAARPDSTASPWERGLRLLRRYFSMGARTRFPHSVQEPS